MRARSVCRRLVFLLVPTLLLLVLPAPAALAAPPTITGFAPQSGPVGTEVVISGSDFTGATSVTFNNVDASFTPDSDTQVTAIVPAAATDGKIKVTTPGGTATSADNFDVTASGLPTITSFAPPSGPVGVLVVINGTNFTGASAVKFGNKAAADFDVDSNTQISATVDNGTQSGPIQVTTPGGTATSSTDFVVAAAGSPAISSFSPNSGAPGTLVTINGTNFTGATDVVFNLTDATSFTVVNSTQITATVANATTTGFIKVTTPSGTATSATKFTVPGTPDISSFSPTSGAPGTSVQINGSNLTGATSVRFNNASATFTVDNPNRITAIVPSNATTGPIGVTTPNGINQSTTNFTVVTPEITSFDPLRGPWGTTVVITGVALSGATAVRFGGTNATSFTVDSSTKITARVANGTVTGRITVALPSGTLTSSEDFVIQHLRTISLSLSRSLRASGRVACEDGTTACAQSVPIKIQRRVDGEWKTVGTGSTDGAGNYGIHVPDKAGKFRAVASKTSLPNGDRCPRAKSSVVLN
jgi:hypothetical protein